MLLDPMLQTKAKTTSSPVFPRGRMLTNWNGSRFTVQLLLAIILFSSISIQTCKGSDPVPYEVSPHIQAITAHYHRPQSNNTDALVFQNSYRSQHFNRCIQRISGSRTRGGRQLPLCGASGFMATRAAPRLLSTHHLLDLMNGM